jgi:DNA-binding response OmpR family regulator
MKLNLVYFDDQLQNIECYEEILSDSFKVIGSTDPRSYKNHLLAPRPHAIMIDVHMPIMNGFELYSLISSDPEFNGCPIFFISSDLSDETKMKSHDKGAVDFLSRSYSEEEIKIRILSRTKMFLQRTNVLTLGNLIIDVANLKTYINSTQLDLTLLEMRLLCSILRAGPGPVSRNDLIKMIWQEEAVKPGTVSTHITNLKIKIGKWDHILKIKDNMIHVMPDQ